MDPVRMRTFFDEMTSLGVEGMMVSPGYSYSKAPDQEHFLRREQTHDLFRSLLGGARKGWRFNQTPLFLEFLQGRWSLSVHPGEIPLTIYLVGRSRVIWWMKGTAKHLLSCWKQRTGISTVRVAAIANVATAWCIVDTNLQQ